MKTLPIVLKNKKILLIGAGKVALQKAEVLHRNNIDFEIITKSIDSDIEKFCSTITVKEFEKSDIKEFEIVVDASGYEGVSKILTKYKKERNILINVVDQPELCDFYFASLLEYGSLKIAISSGGASPTITQVVRDKIKSIIPKNIEELTSKKLHDRTRGFINIERTKEQTKKLLSRVYLVGCGTGDVELLTLKAYRVIQSVDVVFIDHLISDEIIDIIPENTKKVFVGKQKGFHSVKQDVINEMLAEYAAQGLSIARLKSGDPYIFGRGSEEAISLINDGISVEIIPGISSAIAGPSSAGIAPTARGFATNMSIVSAHLAGNRVNLEWLPLLKYSNHTTIVLMGVSRTKEILDCATKIGVDLDMKVAIISNASRANQSSVVGILRDLVELSDGVARPAIMVFGEVVELQKILPKYGE